MNTNDGPLSFDAVIRDVNYRSQLDAMERRMLGMTNTVVRETNKIDTQFARLGQLAAGYFSFTALSALPAQIVKVRSAFESLEIAFSTMLRSKAKADALLGEVRDFAASTPFGLKETATGAKQLLAYGFAAKDLIPTLKRLGDVSAGLGLPLERLTYLYGTTATQGRLFAQDLNQFVGSGIPLISALATQFGVAEDKVRDLVEEGKVGFGEVKKAIEGMTSGSGIFAGTLDAQSKSLAGLQERLGDAWDTMLNNIGKQNQELIGTVITSTTDAVEHYQQFIDVLKVIAISYGTYRAALLLSNVAQLKDIALTEAQAIAKAEAANATGFLTISQTKAAAATALATRAQATLNATLLANPVALVATAIGALVAAYFVFRKEVKEVQSLQELLSESSKDVSTNFGKQKGEINTLIGIIKNQNIAESERKKAYDKLNAITPEILQGLDFEKAKIQDLKKATDEYLVSLKRRIEIERGEGGAKKAYDQDAEAAERLAKAEEDYLRKVKAAKAAANQSPNDPLYSGGAAYGSVALMQAKAELEAAQAYKKQTEKVVKDAEAFLNKAITGAASKEAVQANIQKEEALMSTLDKLSPLYKAAEDRLVGYRQELQKIEQAEKSQQVSKAKTVEQLNAEIKAQKDLQAQQSSKAGYDKIQKEIDALDKQRRRITGELTAEEKKAAQKAQKEADKSGPFGSVAYWESIERKAEEVLSKTPKTDKGKIAQQQAILLNAQLKAEEARKAITLKSFEEELDYKKSRYELYQKWIEAYGKESANNQFGELIKSGQSYLDYLNSQIAQLEAEQKAGIISEKDTKNLFSLRDQREEITGKKTSIEIFTEGLEKARVQAGNLADYLDVLKQKQAELATSNPKTQQDFGIRKELAQEIVKTESELQSRLAQFLTSYASSGEQQLAIQREFSEKRVALDKRYTDKRGDDYKNALSVIDSAEKQALQEFQKRKLEETDEYKKLTKVILEEGQKGLKIQIENQKAVIVKAKELAGINSEVYKAEQKKLSELEKQYSDNVIGNISRYSNILGQFGQSLAGLGGYASGLGQRMVALASQVELVASSFKKGQDQSVLYANAIQGVVGLLSSITTAAAERKQAEIEYYAAIIAYQQEYNILLNEQLGLRTKSKENVFVRDYAGELKDAFAQYEDAEKKYQESLKKLAQGRAKSGLNDVIDGKKALELVGSGAATGAAIGSIVPGIGTAVGAVVGTIVGGITALFGGAKKKEEEFRDLLSLYPELIQKSADGVDQLNIGLAETLIKNNLIDESTKQLLQSSVEWQKQMEAARETVKQIVGTLAGALGDNLRDSLVGAFKEGEDAAQAFSDSVGKIMEDLVTKMLFSAAFGDMFDQLEKDLTKSLDTQNGGDGNVVDDFQRFTEGSKVAMATYNDWLKQFQDVAKASGFDVLKSDGTGTTTNPNSLQGAIKGVTEETASLLAGQINAIRIMQVDTNGIVRQQLLALNTIATNSVYLRYLESIDRKLDTQATSDPLRAKGL